MKVSREPVETRNHRLGSGGLRVADGRLQLTPTIPLAALYLYVFGDQFPTAAVEIPLSVETRRYKTNLPSAIAAYPLCYKS